MQVQNIGLITVQNIILIYTIKPIALRMQVYGISHRFSLNDFFHFYFFLLTLFLFKNYHLEMIIARVCRLLGIPTEE